jgi:hypothetical protein
LEVIQRLGRELGVDQEKLSKEKLEAGSGGFYTP